MNEEIGNIHVSENFEKFLQHAQYKQNNLTKYKLFGRNLFITLCTYLGSQKMADAFEFKKHDPDFASIEMQGKIKYARLVRLNEDTLEQAYRNYLKTYMKMQ